MQLSEINTAYIELCNRQHILERAKFSLNQAIEKLNECICYGVLDETIINLKSKLAEIDREIDEIVNTDYEELLKQYGITEQELYEFQQEQITEVV